MKNFLISFLVFLVWSFFGLWLYSVSASPVVTENISENNISEIKKETDPVIKDTIIASEIVDEIPIAPNKNLIIRSLNEELLFESDNKLTVYNDSVQLSNDLAEIPSILKNYLENHPGQELHIISYYDNTEQPESIDMGEQNGKYVRDLLINEGIDKNQMVVKPIARSTDDDSYKNNEIRFEFKLLDRERIANHKKAIPSLFTFYPKYNFDEIVANNKLAQLTDSIALLHKEHPDLKIAVIGHTDHIGAASENYIRGLRSSRQIRWYLINKGGIDPKNISAISKGESEPILRDGRPASRAENARIEIKFLEKE